MTAQLEGPVVVDASVLVKCFIKEDGSDIALEVLGGMFESPGRFIVPELIFNELANILKRHIDSDGDARLGMFEALLRSPVQRAPVTVELTRAIRRFQKLGLSGYDSAYVALAEYCGGIWLTADTKAHRTVEQLRLSMLLDAYGRAA